MRPVNRTIVAVLGALALAACGDSRSPNLETADAQPVVPGADAAPGQPDGAPQPDGGPVTGTGATATPCDSHDDCAGGHCLGAPGSETAGNPRFTGGYCTTLGCDAATSAGCGPDELCLDGGFNTFCTELCGKADGLTTCDANPQHVCFGVSGVGACMHIDYSECDFSSKTGCAEGERCIWVGLLEEPKDYGTCHATCDPMNDTCSEVGKSCYYIRSYDGPICAADGTTLPDETCSCDKCCTPGHACARDMDGSGRHCKTYCDVATGAGCSPTATCHPLEEGSPWGGCFEPGSIGT